MIWETQPVQIAKEAKIRRFMVKKVSTGEKAKCCQRDLRV